MIDAWHEWIERYRADRKLEGLSARTVTGRAGLLAKFVAWCRGLEIGGPDRLTRDLVADYRRHRIQAINRHGRRDRSFTVNTHLLALRDFLTLLVGKGVVPGGMMEPLRYVKDPVLLPRHVLKHEEVMAMIRRIPGDTPVHVRDRAILEVLYASAIRREELVHLTLDDPDQDGGVIRVRHGKGGKERMAVIGRHAVEWLTRYLESARPALMGNREEHGRVFVSRRGLPLDGSAVREIVRRWAKAAGIATPVGPHTLRRSCATEMIRRGANPGHVKDILGHADFASIDAYVRLAVVDLKETLRKYHPREQRDSLPDLEENRGI